MEGGKDGERQRYRAIGRMEERREEGKEGWRTRGVK